MTLHQQQGQDQPKEKSLYSTDLRCDVQIKSNDRVKAFLEEEVKAAFYKPLEIC
jgi:hypothetical protein